MENDESLELGYYDAVSGFALRFFRYCSRGVGRRESISADQAFHPSAGKNCIPIKSCSYTTLYPLKFSYLSCFIDLALAGIGTLYRWTPTSKPT